MTRIIVASRKQMEATISLDVSHVVISITDPDKPLARIRSQPKDILRLQFYDVDEPHDAYYPIDVSDAKRIVAFVGKWWDLADYLIVHCEAGISRSAGVAAAISKAMLGTDGIFFDSRAYNPNMTCYSYVLKEFYNYNNKENHLDKGLY
jgi:predicted protein tyrosine phosphatase